MYRADYSNYGSYTIKNEIAKQVQELPNDLKELREIFEDSYSNNLGGMFDKVLKNEEYQEDSTELQYRYTVELGWHTPLEILFEAIGISPNLEGQLKDSSRYRSIIGAMLSAKNGVPIGFKFNKLIQVAQLVLESYPEFYTIFLGICSCYGHRHLLDEQDKSGKLAIKAKEREYKTEILDHTFSEIIEFLCPKLNGRLGRVEHS